jgi:hypothetical protein
MCKYQCSIEQGNVHYMFLSNPTTYIGSNDCINLSYCISNEHCTEASLQNLAFLLRSHQNHILTHLSYYCMKSFFLTQCPMHSSGPKIQIYRGMLQTSVDRPGRLESHGHCRTHQGRVGRRRIGQRLFIAHCCRRRHLSFDPGV